VEHPVHQRAQQGGTVHNGRVDELSGTGTGHGVQGRQHPDGEQHPAAPEVTEQVQRRYR